MRCAVVWRLALTTIAIVIKNICKKRLATNRHCSHASLASTAIAVKPWQLSVGLQCFLILNLLRRVLQSKRCRRASQFLYRTRCVRSPAMMNPKLPLGHRSRRTFSCLALLSLHMRLTPGQLVQLGSWLAARRPTSRFLSIERPR